MPVESASPPPHPASGGPSSAFTARSIWRSVGRTVLTWSAIIAALVVGWFIAQGVFALTGRPPGLAGFLVTVAISIVTGGLVTVIVTRAIGHVPPDGDAMRRELLDALDRMAHGDFNVNLVSGGRGPMPDVIDSVNQMARQLGDLEQQRQDFISSVSHEIQSPLTSISGFAALLQADNLPDDRRRHYLDVIQTEARRVSALGDNLLRLSALEEGTALAKRTYRLDQQLRGVIVALEPQWSAKGLTVEVEAAELMVEADEDMLYQVWTNLIHNAVKYTDAGRSQGELARPGEVKDGIDEWGGDDTDAAGGVIRVELAAAADGDGLICRVMDTGVGIGPSDLPHVFERFYRADKARGGGGSGLGLPLARKIVELHGGTISLTSQLGLGSTFTVHLPA